MKSVLLAVIGGLLLAPPVHAQSHITGRVLDAQQNPVANVEVLLHAVTETSGTNVDTDTTDANGAFRVDADAVISNAVYFVAVVYDGELYMGDLMRAPFPARQEYIVRVGVNPVNLPTAATARELAAPPSGKERAAGLVVIVSAIVMIAALLVIGFRRRPPVRRRWLVELARLEDELDSGTDARDALARRRHELRERLKAPRSG
ncbi:MAG: carboxypeptidase-like regulatory domain-containing protein [Gemmatimonadota bacterium]